MFLARMQQSLQGAAETCVHILLQVHLYNMFGTQLPRHFSMGSEVQRDGILECQLYGDGLVVLTKELQLWAVSGLAEPRPQKLASPGLKEAPSCMAIFQPRHTLSGCLEVILLKRFVRVCFHQEGQTSPRPCGSCCPALLRYTRAPMTLNHRRRGNAQQSQGACSVLIIRQIKMCRSHEQPGQPEHQIQ